MLRQKLACRRVVYLWLGRETRTQRPIRYCRQQKLQHIVETNAHMSLSLYRAQHMMTYLLRRQQLHLVFSVKAAVPTPCVHGTLSV